jgi:hypothetical protein
VRTTIDIPEREHALCTSLAWAQRTNLGKLLLALAQRGLEATSRAAEAVPANQIDPETGLGVFHSGRPVTSEDVKALEDDEPPAGKGA